MGKVMAIKEKVSRSMTGIWRKLGRVSRYYLIRIFRLKQGSSKIALGFVLGFFPCWFPTFGIGPAASVALAKFAKVNVVAAIVAAALGSFMWPILFPLNYQMGGLFNGDPSTQENNFHHVGYNREEYMESFNWFAETGYTFAIGAIVNSILFTGLGYIVLYYIFSRYRLIILGKLRSSLKSKS